MRLRLNHNADAGFASLVHLSFVRKGERTACEKAVLLPSINIPLTDVDLAAKLVSSQYIYTAARYWEMICEGSK